jgi:hypothetical protein
LTIPVCLLAGLAFTPSLRASTSFAYDGFSVVQQNPGSYNTTQPGTITENFSEFSTGAVSTSPGISVLGGAATLTGGNIFGQNEYGGTGSPGNFYVIGDETGTVTTSPGALTFHTPQSFFGMWWSAADAQNELQFYNGSTLLATFVSSEPSGSPATTGANITQGLGSSYQGNPSGTGPYSGQDSGEDFVYLDFTDTVGSFTSVVFTDGNSSTGFEMDNFSILARSSSVPDMPGTLSLLGLGLSGLAAIGRRFRK